MSQQVVGEVAHREARTIGVRTVVENNALLALLILVGAFFAVLPASREVFLSADNLSVMLGNQATVALLALAAILPLVSGYFDFPWARSRPPRRCSVPG
jgi:ABC-type xylose transport system permease subunit